MEEKAILYYIKEVLDDQVDHWDCLLSQNKNVELSAEGMKLSLLRTTIDDTLRIQIIKDHKKGSISVNKMDQKSIDEAIQNVLDICDSSEPDEAFEIAPKQESKTFKLGEPKPNLDQMYTLLSDYLTSVETLYPTIKLMETSLNFVSTNRTYINSNEVNYVQQKGVYRFSSVFSAKEGSKMSSFNFSQFSLDQLSDQILKVASINTILKQTTEQLETKTIEGKFSGDAIFTPDCFDELIKLYVDTYLRDASIISGTSLLKDQLNQQVASPLLSIHSVPRSNKIKDGYCITTDGFEANDLTIIDKGVLKSFLLTLYGSNKTKFDRAINNGGCYYVDAGNIPLSDMIKTINQGVYISRFSGGHPNSNGDLTVVLKNSYYIEDGEIQYPLSETSISVNLRELFENIKGISKEQIDFGTAILPYIKVENVLTSGK